MVRKPVKDKEPIMWALPLPVISGNGYGGRKLSPRDGLFVCLI